MSRERASIDSGHLLLRLGFPHPDLTAGLGRGKGAAGPLPDDALRILMRGADKEDKMAA